MSFFKTKGIYLHFSTISSGINSIASCVFHDVIKENKLAFSETHGAMVSKFIALISGILVIGLAVVISLKDDLTNSLLMVSLFNV